MLGSCGDMSIGVFQLNRYGSFASRGTGRMALLLSRLEIDEIGAAALRVRVDESGSRADRRPT